MGEIIGGFQKKEVFLVCPYLPLLHVIVLKRLLDFVHKLLEIFSNFLLSDFGFDFRAFREIIVITLPWG